MPSGIRPLCCPPTGNNADSYSPHHPYPDILSTVLQQRSRFLLLRFHITLSLSIHQSIKLFVSNLQPHLSFAEAINKTPRVPGPQWLETTPPALVSHISEKTSSSFKYVRTCSTISLSQPE